MRVSVKIGLLFAAIFIVIKLAFYFSNSLLDELQPFVILNIVLLTSSIGLAIYKENRSVDKLGNFFDDVKLGMRTGLPYSILVSVFLFFYYNNIYPDFAENKVNQIKDELKKKEKIEEIRDSNDALSNRSDDEIRNQMIENTTAMYSPKFTLVVSLLGLTLFSVINSILLALIIRKVIFRI
jgi:hypothetical protein